MPSDCNGTNGSLLESIGDSYDPHRQLNARPGVLTGMIIEMKERTQVCVRATSPPHPQSKVAEAACGGVMKSLKKALDPTQVGSEAGKLVAGLHQRIVGQDEAIHAIVSAYHVSNWLRHG